MNVNKPLFLGRLGNRFGDTVIALLVGVIVFCVYLPSLDNGFVNYDDFDYILNNFAIRSLDFNLLRWSFGEFHLQFYIPFTWLSLALDYHFWELNPKGFHLTNSILHALNAGLVSLIARELIDVLRSRKKQDILPELLPRSWIFVACLAAGLLFGLHPLRVESVAWATERKDVLSAFFILPAFITYFRCVQAKGNRERAWQTWYGATIILFLFSLLSKPMMVTFPVILLLFDWYPFDRLGNRDDRIRAIKEKVPFICMSLLFLLLVLVSQLSDGIPLEQTSVVSRLLLACKSVISYLLMMVWPVGLIPLYPHPGNRIPLGSPEYLFPLAAVIFLSGLSCRQAAKGDRKWLWLWGYFLITLLPVLGFTQVGPQAMADRFTYLPSVFPSIAATFLILRIPLACAYTPATHAVATSIVAVIVSGILWGDAVISRKLMAVWHDSETLWSRVIDVKPMESAEAYHHRGYYYADRGDFRQALEDLSASIAVAEAKQRHNLPDAYLGRGDIYLQMHCYQEAYDDFSKGIEVSPKPNSLLNAYHYTARQRLAEQIQAGHEDHKHSP